jgi:hypothetical protein
MPAFTKYNCFPLDLGKALHDFTTHAVKLALTNTAPNVATHAVLTDITEIAAANGYVAGGMAVTVLSWAQAAGIAKLVASADDVFTAAGGNFGPARYGVLYNNTSATKPLIAYYDKGASLTVYDTDTWTFDYDQANGLFTVT